MPGDVVAARLVNRLDPSEHAERFVGMSHGVAGENPTNLHYFHGGIVTPNNARPADATRGNGDNVYVRLSNEPRGGSPPSFDYHVPVPGDPAPAIDRGNVPVPESR